MKFRLVCTSRGSYGLYQQNVAGDGEFIVPDFCEGVAGARFTWRHGQNCNSEGHICLLKAPPDANCAPSTAAAPAWRRCSGAISPLISHTSAKDASKR